MPRGPTWSHSGQRYCFARKRRMFGLQEIVNSCPHSGHSTCARLMPCLRLKGIKPPLRFVDAFSALNLAHLDLEVGHTGGMYLP